MSEKFSNETNYAKLKNITIFYLLTFRDFFIIGWGLNSSSEKLYLLGSKFSSPGIANLLIVKWKIKKKIGNYINIVSLAYIRINDNIAIFSSYI